jgi:hypothetical protein
MLGASELPRPSSRRDGGEMGVLGFIQVLVAIILGLGMAEILKDFADLLRPGRTEVSQPRVALGLPAGGQLLRRALTQRVNG